MTVLVCVRACQRFNLAPVYEQSFHGGSGAVPVTNPAVGKLTGRVNISITV